MLQECQILFLILLIQVAFKRATIGRPYEVGVDPTEADKIPPISAVDDVAAAVAAIAVVAVEVGRWRDADTAVVATYSSTFGRKATASTSSTDSCAR